MGRDVVSSLFRIYRGFFVYLRLANVQVKNADFAPREFENRTNPHTHTYADDTKYVPLPI